MTLPEEIQSIVIKQIQRPRATMMGISMGMIGMGYNGGMSNMTGMSQVC